MTRGEIFRELVELMGREDAAQIVRLAGGLRIYIPKPDNVPGSPSEGILGPDLALRLAEHYCGEFLEVPCLRPSSHRVNRIQLIRLIAENPDASVADLARQGGVTSRWIVQLRRQLARAAAAEPPLLQMARQPSPDREG